MANETELLTQEQYDTEWDRLAQERDGGDDTPPESTERVAAESTAAPAAQTAQAPAAQTQQAEDPLASLPQAARDKLAQIDRLSQEFSNSQRELKAAQGRIGALQQELQASRQVAPQAAAKPTEAQIAAAAKSPAKWEAMKQDFPEWADAIEAMVESRLGAIKPAPQLDPNLIDQRVQQLLANEHQARAARAQVENSVETKHPGWKAKVGTQDFAAWHATLPPGLQRLADSPDPLDAIYLLDMYGAKDKQATQAVTDDRKQRLKQAATNKPGVTPPRKSEEEMSFDELWDHEARKRDAKRDPMTGRFR